jgi:hypothetical protein
VEIVGMFDKAFLLALENRFMQDAALAKELSWKVPEEHTRLALHIYG